VLELARRIRLGVDVGDLLQLERALEGDGVVDAAPEEERMPAQREVGGPVGDRALALERARDQGG
jgi:hypothetical protein